MLTLLHRHVNAATTATAASKLQHTCSRASEDSLYRDLSTLSTARMASGLRNRSSGSCKWASSTKQQPLHTCAMCHGRGFIDTHAAAQPHLSVLATPFCSISYPCRVVSVKICANVVMGRTMSLPFAGICYVTHGSESESKGAFLQCKAVQLCTLLLDSVHL